MSTAQQGVALNLNSVSFLYSPRELILDQIALKINPGEFVSILGPSGCGKSTLLRLLAGLERPHKGTIQFEVENDIIDRGIVFQEPRLLPWRTVLENVKLPLELAKDINTKSDQIALESLKRVNLLDAANKYPAQLSGGMKMRVAVARALVSQPKLLLLDEPFSSLDEYTRQNIQNDLRLLWSNLKMTTIFITHSISEATYLSDRVIIFSNRPARIISDQMINLPAQRSPSLRLNNEFNIEMQKLARFLSLKDWT